MKIRKILAILVILAVLVGILPTQIFAVSSTSLKITPNKKEAHPGDTITYTVSMGAVTNLYGMVFELSIPEGLTFVDGKAVDGITEKLNAAKAEFTPSTKVFVVGSSNYTSTSSTNLMTFICKVNEGVTGSKSVTFKIDEDDIFDKNYDNIKTDYSNPGSTVTITKAPIPATGISLNKTTLSIEKGSNETLKATVSPDNTTDKVVWSSSNNSVATVDNAGKVTAVAEGNATISAKAGEKVATCTLTVTKPACTHTNKTKTVAKAATCTEAGNNDYWKCDDCGQVFKADGTTKSTLEAETIKALGHNYTILEKDSTNHWYKCSRCNAINTKKQHSSATWKSDEGNHWKVCSCGTVIQKAEHTKVKVKANEVAATCSAEGHYDEVEKCSTCGKVFSTTKKTIEKVAHTPAKAVQENVKPSTCEKEGSYDEVIYCSICKEELSRETKTIEKLPHDGSKADWSSNKENHWKVCGCGTIVDTAKHTPAEVVKEKIVPATCTKSGSHDEVVYCSVCKYEISRKEGVEDKAIGHTPAEAVKEKEIKATCIEKGSYDEVVYCSNCNEELSRKSKVEELAEHTKGEPVKENIVEATQEKEGSYDEVVYCLVCEKELSREEKTIDKKAYTESTNQTGNSTVSTDKENADKESTDKESNATKVTTTGVKTGDESNMILWISGLAVSGILFVGAILWIVKGQKRKTGRHF